MRDTNAIGVFPNLALKNQVDDHAETVPAALPERAEGQRRRTAATATVYS